MLKIIKIKIETLWKVLENDKIVRKTGGGNHKIKELVELGNKSYWKQVIFIK